MMADPTKRVCANVLAKLQRNNIKVASVIVKCEVRDKNRDGIIHQRDLKEILNSVLPASDAVIEREIAHIAFALNNYQPISSKTGIQYIRLFDVLDDSNLGEESSPAEHWMDDEDIESEQWATEKGSLGEWLKKAACPSEIINFKKFMARLEDYERSSGINCVKTKDGFIVPMGPDLRASIQFYTV